MGWKTLVLFLFTLTSYWILTLKRKYVYTLEFELKNLDPRPTWELFSSFSNYTKLNPTIISYEILSETKRNPNNRNGFYSEFTVHYKEYLVYLPFIVHEAWSTYEIFEANPNTGQHFKVVSNHVTHLLGTSMNTTEIANFLPTASHAPCTRIHATVKYDCFIILAFYCNMEFLGQRALIHKNLESIASAETVSSK